jgi:apolipoprotein N-acyltransferase
MQIESVIDVPGRPGWFLQATSYLRTNAPTRLEWTAAATSTVLLILSFPNFNLPFLAWVALVPLLFALTINPSPVRAFMIGWPLGTVFFYATCHWLTYSMINYGGIPTPIAYALLIPGALVVGLFPALFASLAAYSIKRWGHFGLLLAPFIWTMCEWFRLGVTGQLWNALGYSQAEFQHGLLIGPAQLGGVYAVSFLIIAVNTSLALVLSKRKIGTGLVAAGIIIATACLFVITRPVNHVFNGLPDLYVIAVQPNVPMTLVKTLDELKELRERHLSLSEKALRELPADNVPRLVVWPESPMNFTYAEDRMFQELIAKFTRDNHTSLLLNALEPAPQDGAYNSALLINEGGRLISQYDKIRLMPFGEYVPVPGWLGGSLISGLVGEFTPGDKYTLMPVGSKRAGVFICIESAYPWIARRMTAEGADVLVNISNDGYLGPTAVMHQHLANTIFRAVENGRPLLRVTNTGLTASITADGVVKDITAGYVADVRTWKVTTPVSRTTLYTRFGDLFVGGCALVSILGLVAGVLFKRSDRRLG